MRKLIQIQTKQLQEQSKALEQQQKELNALKARLDAPQAQKPGAAPGETTGSPDAPKEEAVKKIVEEYLKSQDSKDGNGKKKKEAFDPAQVSAGRAAFDRSCTTCHDADRALEATKNLADWRKTVQRMAKMKNAKISDSDIEPISTYLASESVRGSSGGDAGASGSSAEAGGKATGEGKADDTSSSSFFATVSPMWRNARNTSPTQNTGFFPAAWVGASWQGKIVSARISACVACHETAILNHFELLEAAVRIDGSSLLDKVCSGMKGGIEAGRFIVPFGAFSSQTNPSVYRTVSQPLIFNMGQIVTGVPISVLPMPYANQGISGDLSIPICDDFCGKPITATLDGYLIDGLEGTTGGVNYFGSRELIDNKNSLSGGGRVTLGSPTVRGGASILGGRYNVDSVPGHHDYLIYGYDFQARYKDLIRFQAEYARRDNDQLNTLRGSAFITGSIDGYYLEGEVRPWEKCRVSFLARYDSETRESFSNQPSLTYQRMTYGINIALWKQSLLMLDFERWRLPLPLRNVDLWGARYVITF